MIISYLDPLSNSFCLAFFLNTLNPPTPARVPPRAADADIGDAVDTLDAAGRTNSAAPGFFAAREIVWALL